MPRLILASQSPRRATLLEQIGLEFEQRPANVDESVRENEPAAVYVERLARCKAATIASAVSDVVLAADTTVVLDEEILGKPHSTAAAEAMLLALSGRQHQVITGVAVALADDVETVVVTTEVRFVSLAPAQVKRYVASGEPMDKAGAYGIQGLGAVLVAGIRGSYSNVVGLPLTETAQLLAARGIDVLSGRERI